MRICSGWPLGGADCPAFATSITNWDLDMGHHSPVTAPTQTGTRRWLMAYDIGDDRRRARISALLAGHGVRVQRSVFVVEGTQHAVVGLLGRAESMLGEGDRLDAWPVVHHAGLPTPWQRRQQRTRLPDFWLA